MKRFEFPVTKAKTAWGLLVDVKRRVRQVPEAIDMRTVLDMAATACGSVGCLAGECVLLTLGYRKAIDFDTPNKDSRMTFAYRLLGGASSVSTPEQVAFESALDSFFDAGSSDGIAKLEPGTPAYIDAVIARVDKFMATHEARLKRTKLARAFDAAPLAKERA